eukprot:1066917-Pyramimonas_sp.AAC.1
MARVGGERPEVWGAGAGALRVDVLRGAAARQAAAFLGGAPDEAHAPQEAAPPASSRLGADPASATAAPAEGAQS